MTNNDKQAAAVLDGLTQTITCDECGAIHSHGKKVPPHVGQYALRTTHVSCACGRSHGDRILCACGTLLAYGPKAGGRMVARKHGTWLRRERRLLARIAELEAQR
jgi:hypothetical protein